MATLFPRHPQVKRRRPLGELDPNKDLNTCRSKSRRAPITFEQENENAVLDGIEAGIYDINEVIWWTDHHLYSHTAAIGDAHDSDDEHLGPSHNPPSEGEGGEGTDTSEAETGAAFDDDADEYFGDIMDEDLAEELDEEDPDNEDEEINLGPVFDPAAMGLKEINNLAHFGVSSHKPGNGVEELLSDDLDKYWQSDGQQPHLLTIHFLRRVEIRAIRFYVDYSQDESYTPTHIVFYAGTGHHDLIQFAEVPLTNPLGWQDVPIADCGGGPDGHSLCCWIVQIHIKENHQNGKDTHIRGIKIFALDENSAGGAVGDAVHEMEANIDQAAAADRYTLRDLAVGEDDTFQELLDALDRNIAGGTRYRPGEGGFSNFPDFMRDPEIR
ncbi:galactose-binding domain-like protein [Podospora appendiculata]|uniref:Galactose-binding domain-like protein n=1 Tax=Podospora appendiculata TaxID=314037 RepID=A0AAE0X3Z9_9PEZI|nr:galactose-binding domain-like protein [Podospora appendiculata]